MVKHLKNSFVFIATTLFLFFALSFAQSQEPIAADVGWPRVLEHPKATVTIYQPQVDSFKNDIIEGRAAVSVTLNGETEPIFGAIWYKARVETDRDTRMVTIINVKIPRTRFPDSKPEQEKELSEFLEQEIPKWEMNISLDRLLAGLDMSEKERIAAENLKNDPPKILIEYSPAILVFIDGEPIREKIENSNLERVVNTPFLIVYEKQSKAYFLNGGELWMISSNIMGPWSEAKRLPREVSQITPKDSEDMPKIEATDDRLPKVVVATDPTELVVIDGKPDYAPIEETDLLYVTNTESDLLMDMATQQYLVLLSGRWYASKLLNGPWAHIPSDELPESFKNIPEDSENGHLLSFIAGTEQAKEAVLDAQIPQTSAIKRDSGKDLKVEYDGNPKFEKAEGTEVEYAANTSSAVFKVENTYYCCSEAVWYVSKKADGPWEVCDKVPDVIYTIPPSCPHYNTKYVYVYDTTPSVVYVGYYPGYMGSYIYGPTIVYGTGWYYRPWYGRYYYPHHWTWGFHVRWNPWYG
ncbi:MAG: carbohydrate-binding family V/XII, partial [Candidatus Aminicenantes bacterium]